MPYVKAELTSELNTALEIISKKVGISKSSITNTALEQYFKNLYPEVLPLSNEEIYENVRAEYLKKATYRRYELIQMGADSLGIAEEEISKLKMKIEKQKAILNMKEKSLEPTKNNKKRTEIQKDIRNLKHFIENCQTQLSNAERILTELREGKETF